MHSSLPKARVVLTQTRRTSVPSIISLSKMRSVSSAGWSRHWDGVPAMRSSRMRSTPVLSAYMCPARMSARAISTICGKKSDVYVSLHAPHGQVPARPLGLAAAESSRT